MTKLLIVSIMSLFIVACATESKVEKTETVANYDLKSVERMPSQVTGDFGKMFLSTKANKDSLCSATVGAQLYGNKIGFNSINEEKAVRAQLKKKLREEARVISDHFMNYINNDLKGNQHCEDYAVQAAKELVERAACFHAVLNTVYSEEGIKKIPEYSKAKDYYYERMDHKEKIDAGNMPMVGQDSCKSQGLETDSKIIEKNTKFSMPLAIFLDLRFLN